MEQQIPAAIPETPMVSPVQPRKRNKLWIWILILLILLLITLMFVNFVIKILGTGSAIHDPIIPSKTVTSTPAVSSDTSITPQTVDVRLNCIQDTDCVTVQVGPCGCNKTSINKQFETEWNNRIAEERKVAMCPISSSESACGIAPLSQCIQNKCQLQ